MSSKKSWIPDAAVAVLALFAAAGLAACSGTALSTTGPSAVVAIDDATPMVIFTSVFEDLEMGQQRITDLSLPSTGTLVVTLRWSNQNNYVTALLSGAGCSRVGGYGPACPVRNSIERQGKEGREGHIELRGASGGYRLLVENQGPGRESIHVMVELLNPDHHSDGH